MSELEDLKRRIDQLESLEQIRQLPAKYALSVDMRNFDAVANLFVEDVTVSRSKQGRQAMKEWYSSVLRGPLIGSAHGVAGHIIDLEGPDLATGLVYSRNDLETASTWMIEMMAYLDRYERRDGIWYFQRRTPLYWYQCDITNPPLGGGENKLRWEGQEWTAGAFHDAFPTWAEFWANADAGKGPVKPPAPLHRFLETFRGTGGPPRVNASPNKH
ncbi:MAG TPA: nuclear transport factor 2 family protein [Novosphingobium sp.]